MKNNPFTLDFGAEPGLYIPRISEYNKMIDTFESEEPSSHIFILTGVRGSGKTVLMTTVSHKLCEDSRWMHVDLNTEGNMLEQLAADIYKTTKAKLPKVKLEINVKGFGITVDRNEKYQNIQTDLDQMIETLKKHKMKLLITIDEASNCKDLREFTNYYQHCIREKLPVYLIMTGLYKNIRALQNNRTQTFLRRAPRIDLGALNNTRISLKYAEVFGAKPDMADRMARLTLGYSYAFQMLGYLVYESGSKELTDEIITEYKLNLEECSYDKIWEELSAGERRVASAIAGLEANVTVKEVRDVLGIDSNSFSTYQDSLAKCGILSKESSYGRLNFALPFFKEYAINHV